MRRRDVKINDKREDRIASNVHSEDNFVRKGERYWSNAEHDRFIKAVLLHGKNWTEITNLVGTRSR